MQIIDKILGIDRLKAEIKAYQSATTISMYNQIYPSWTSYKEIAAYKILDDIYSVVSRLAKTSAAVPLYGYSADGEDLPDSDKLAVFLRKFTYIKKIELYTWLYLRGECFIYKEKTLSGVNGNVDRVYFLNPSYVTLVLSNEWPEEVTGYWYRDNQRGVERWVEKDEIVFIKNFNPSDDYYLSWRGLSPITVLCQRLTRMESNMKNSVAQMQNGGVPGVMYSKDLPNTIQSKGTLDQVKTNFARFLGNHENKGAPFIQAGEWGYFNTGSTLVDLASIDLEQVDFKKICNAWGVSDRLFNNDATGSEISDDNAQLGLYTNAIIPTITMVEDAFNTELVKDFGVGEKYVKHDLASVYILQVVQQRKAAAWANSPVMIPNQVLVDMGQPRVDDPLMDKPLIKSGYQAVDDFEPLPPIE